MKKLLVSIYLIIPIISHGQNRKLIKPEFLDQNHFFYKIHDNMNSCLYIFYNDTIQYNSYYKSNYDYLYKNSLKTDSIDINLSFDNPIRFLDRKTWFILPRESKIYQLDKKYHFKEFFSKDSIIIFDLYNNYFLSVEKYNNTSNRRNQILYSIDILNGEYKKIIDLRSILSENSTAASLAKRNLWLGWNKRKEHE